MSILLGNGDGTFQIPVEYVVTSRQSPSCVAVGDFNADGALDVAVASPSEGNVMILLGNGNGTFRPPTGFSAGLGPVSIAVGDFNRDGLADLAVANSDTLGGLGTVNILLGKGDGTFATGPTYSVGTTPSSLTLGDLNGDGIADLAVITSGFFTGTVSILLGNGDGTFQAPRDINYSTNSQVLLQNGVAMADLNGDGHLDLALTDARSGLVVVLPGNGDGTFGAAQSYIVGGYPAAVAVGDFAGTGTPGLAVASVATDTGVLSILLGKGDGTLQAEATYPAGIGPQFGAIADFNGDGIPDLAVASSVGGLGGAVLISLGKGDGTFQAPKSYATRTAAYSVAVADFNGDGVPDLAVSGGPGSSVVSVLLGKGDGTFGNAETYTVGDNPGSVVVGDFNQDGTPDLAVANNASGTVSVLLGKGDGTFRSAQTYTVGMLFEIPTFLAVADFNGDGIPDLAVTLFNYSTENGSVSILLGKGDGTFGTAHKFPVGSNPYSVAVADFNGDGIPDLAVANHVDNSVSILLGEGNGNFRAARSVAVGIQPSSVAVADFNGDGFADLVVTNFNDGTISLLLGRGNGTFQAAQTYLVGPGPSSIVAGDLNHDGFPDLVIANSASNTVGVLLNAGNW